MKPTVACQIVWLIAKPEFVPLLIVNFVIIRLLVVRYALFFCHLWVTHTPRISRLLHINFGSYTLASISHFKLNWPFDRTLHYAWVMLSHDHIYGSLYGIQWSLSHLMLDLLLRPATWFTLLLSTLSLWLSNKIIISSVVMHYFLLDFVPIWRCIFRVWLSHISAVYPSTWFLWLVWHGRWNFTPSFILRITISWHETQRWN